MLTQRYTAQQRRALNQIWTAAGEYGFEPMFLAMNHDGTPDLYMNCIVGCVRKWYGQEMPRKLFGAWAEDRRQAMLDDLAWLALENAAFQRELPERPMLAQARRTHAEEFFDQEYLLSRQEWWAKNQLVYTMQSARWKRVLGRREPVMTPYERRLSDALLCSGQLNAEELAERILQAFALAGLFDGMARSKASLQLHFDGKWALALTRFLPTQLVHTDMLTLGQASVSGSKDGSGAKNLRGKLRLKENAETDRQYIACCFGRSLYPPEQLAAAERALCTGNHLGCHLWFSEGIPDPELARSGESRRLSAEAALQFDRNRDAFSRDSGLYLNIIARLTEQIRSCIQLHSQTETERTRSGRLDSSRTWRAAILEDEQVFFREVNTTKSNFSVDLLLDGSASRMHCQETIATQGFILAESLRQCGVPVRVTSFCSLRGYTVLRILKDFEDRNQKIFHYFASGWNRDGLALRAAGELMKYAPEGRHLLLLLTDASPNDSHRFPSGEGKPFGQEYAEQAAVKDTAQEVRALQRRGIRVAAVFMGTNRSAPDAAAIYGKSMVRIQSMDQLAGAAGALIRQEIQELSVSYD